MRSAIQTLEVSYFLHATEDLGKVKPIVAALIGSKAPPQVEEMIGHFGNPIEKVELRLHGDEAAKSLDSVMSKLPPSLRADLLEEIDEHLDEHSSLFIRLDKQKLVQGQLAMGSSDVVRIKVKPKALVMKGRAREFFTDLLRRSR